MENFKLGDYVQITTTGFSYPAWDKNILGLMIFLRRYKPRNLSKNDYSRSRYVELETYYKQNNDFANRTDLTWRVRYILYCDTELGIYKRVPDGRLYVIMSNQNDALLISSLGIIKK